MPVHVSALHAIARLTTHGHPTDLVQFLARAGGGPAVVDPDGDTLGFRAEDAGVAAEGGEIRAPVYSMELLGDASMVTVQCGKSLAAVKTPKDFRIAIGAPVGITVPASACHFFDARSGQRVEHSRKG